MDAQNEIQAQATATISVIYIMISSWFMLFLHMCGPEIVVQAC